jgi:hypothetical protein
MTSVPKAYFLEHFMMQLRRESAANLLEKLLDCMLRLLGSICVPAPGYYLSYRVMAIGNNADKDTVVGDNDVGPLICLRLSTSKIRQCSRSAVIEFVFAYVCAPHAIHNLCMDLIKHFPGVKLVLKQILYWSRLLNHHIYCSSCLTNYAWRNTRRNTFLFCS